MPDAFTQTRHEQMAVVDDRGSLPGIAGASQRYAGASVAPRVLILLAGHGGGDLPRRHRVGRDAVLAELQRQRLDQATEAVFGRAIGS